MDMEAVAKATAEAMEADLRAGKYARWKRAGAATMSV